MVSYKPLYRIRFRKKIRNFFLDTNTDLAKYTA